MKIMKKMLIATLTVLMAVSAFSAWTLLQDTKTVQEELQAVGVDMEIPWTTEPGLITILEQDPFQTPTNGAVICNTTTCECYNCTSRPPNCQPVPPPSWCNPS